MVIRIDTTAQKTVEVILKDQGVVIASLVEENEFGSQVILPLIERLLKENNLDFKDLVGIEVATGPGSFTGLRVGVSVANALGFSLGIPINGKEIETELEY